MDTEPLPLNELADFAFNSAKTIIEVREQRAQPCCLMQTATTVIPVLFAGVGNAEEQEAVYKFIHDKLLEVKAISYAFVAEAWRSEQKEGERWNRVRPSADPNRVEVLTITAFDSEGQGMMLDAVITEVRGKRKVGEPRITTTSTPGASLSGATIDFFTPR